MPYDVITRVDEVDISTNALSGDLSLLKILSGVFETDSERDRAMKLIEQDYLDGDDVDYKAVDRLPGTLRKLADLLDELIQQDRTNDNIEGAY